MLSGPLWDGDRCKRGKDDSDVLCLCIMRFMYGRSLGGGSGRRSEGTIRSIPTFTLRRSVTYVQELKLLIEYFHYPAL
jgi:hypothetical protein